ncbi:OmpA family protein [bacterium]|nr:OmpA family protein [bacterium]
MYTVNKYQQTRVSKLLSRLAAVALFLLSFSSHSAEFTFPHIGADFHYLRLNTGVPGELNKNGFSTDFKVGTILSDESWEVETNLGMRYAKLSASVLSVTRKLSYLSGAFEVIPRYRLDPEWSLGLNLTTLYGTDLSHSEVEEQSSNALFLAGLSSRYQLKDSSWSFVFNARKELNLADTGLWSFGAGVLYHFGSKKKASVYSIPEPEAPRAEVSFEVATKTLLIRLPEDVLLFETSMSHLKQPQKSYVQEIGRILNSYPESWKVIAVFGHTDFRGSDQMNQELSEGRAKSVREELVKSGVAPKAISSLGMGETRPIEEGKDAYSLQRNRRVEILIKGGEQNLEMEDELRAVDPASFQ